MVFKDFRVILKDTCRNKLSISIGIHTNKTARLWTPDRTTLNLGAGIMLTITLLCSVIHCGCFAFSHLLFSQLWRNAFVYNKKSSQLDIFSFARCRVKTVTWRRVTPQTVHPATHTSVHKIHFDRLIVFSQHVLTVPLATIDGSLCS